MLLTITWEGQGTRDLGFLLGKHPDRAQTFSLSFGKAHVFYPEASETRTTVALLLEIDPLDLARGKPGSFGGGLFDYVNDRPYAATSFLSTAISKVFGSALNGRCKERPALAEQPLDLTARLFSLKDQGNEELARELFEPLGYMVSAQRRVLDGQFPEWGMSPYVDLTIRGTVTLARLLNHLYVLIPVFDRQKHYYVTRDEIAKLLRHGEGWLADHPFREKIVRRSFQARQRAFAGKTLEALLAEDSEEEEETAEETGDVSEPDGFGTETPDETAKKPAADGEKARTEESGEVRIPLNTRRLQAVRQAVLDSGATSVLDLGCGEGRLTAMLLAESRLQKIGACDVSVSALERAKHRLRVDRMRDSHGGRLTLFQASAIYRDARFEGYDCLCLVEVLEHLPPERISVLERVIFRHAAPKTVIVTTPNREYNVHYAGMKENALRHGDHRFEWTREEFRTWTEHVCRSFGYSCRVSGIGDEDERDGTPTQMGVFVRNG